MFWTVAPILAWGQASSRRAPPSNPSAASPPCQIRRVTDLPGTHQFAADFIEAMAVDPDPTAQDRNVVWALTADLDSKVPARKQALYISRSADSGATWTMVARIRPAYFDAKISEGLRNGFSVSPGGKDFVLTTQDGAFQIFPRADPSAPLVQSIAGPRVPYGRPRIPIPKKPGEPVRAGVVLMTADGQHLIIAFGYFDLNPQLFTYRRGPSGSWIEDRPLPHLPNDLDIFSMAFDHPSVRHPHALYVGTGDQAYRLGFRTMRWTRVAGVGPDSAIHGMSTVAGLHIAACWGVYNPVGATLVRRVTQARFLLHRAKDQVGPNIRAYGIWVDPAHPNREVLPAITGVYVSADSGQTWRRLNDLPEGEFHSAHFNPDGTVLVSGYVGTFLVNPFSRTCSPHLVTRKGTLIDIGQ